MILPNYECMNYTIHEQKKSLEGSFDDTILRLEGGERDRYCHLRDDGWNDTDYSSGFNISPDNNIALK